jgi:glycosyltransferase involved in cell wall biosynthesis
MKIVLPLGSIGWKGGDNYVESLRFALQNLEKEKKVKLVKYKPFETFMSKFEKLLSPRNREIVAYQLYGHRAVNLPWPIVAKKRKPIFWIPDVQDLDLPGNFDESELTRRHDERVGIIYRGGYFYFSSNSIQTKFSKSYPMAKTLGTIRFTSNLSLVEADQNSTEILCECIDSKNFMYAPNQWWIHKNHKNLIDAYNIYRLEGGTRHLALTGPQNDSRRPELEQEILELINSSPYEIHNFGLASRELQTTLFLNCSYVVQVSNYEGWSTIVEEALKFQKMLVLSDIEVHREQLEGEFLAKFCDPNDANSISETLHAMDKEESSHHCNYLLREQRFQDDILELLKRYKNRRLKDFPLRRSH